MPFVFFIRVFLYYQFIFKLKATNYCFQKVNSELIKKLDIAKHHAIYRYLGTMLIQTLSFKAIKYFTDLPY